MVTDTQVHGFAGPADNTAVHYAATGGQLHLMLQGSNDPNLAETYDLLAPQAVTSVEANGGDDTINVLALNLGATVSGGPGDDIINAGKLGNSLDKLQGPLTVFGSAGADTLNVTDKNAAAGQVYTLTGAALLRSGAGQISFDASLETLNLTTSQFGDQVALLGMLLVQAVTLDAGAGSDGLSGPMQPNVWHVATPNGGDLNGVVAFLGVESLKGGSLADAFVIAPGAHLQGGIDGMSGEDRLDYSPWSKPVEVNLAGGTATAVLGGVLHVEDVIGGSGDDIVLGDGQANVLEGGPGDDVLVGGGGADLLSGGAGRDLLIGGDGADQLLGGTGQDILIGGTTSYDTNLAALTALMNEWQRTGLDYLDRISHLRNGGGLNQQYRLSNATVFDDQAADVLTGGPDLDWFWVLLAGPNHDTITPPPSGEMIN